MEVEVVEGTTMVGWVVSGVAFWWTAFLLARGAFPKRSYDFCNRAVSAAHAAAAVSLACLSVADWSRPLSPLAAASSPPQVRIIPTRTTIRTIHTYARWSSSSSLTVVVVVGLAADEGAGGDAVVHGVRRGVLLPQRRRQGGQHRSPPRQHRRHRRRPRLPEGNLSSHY